MDELLRNRFTELARRSYNNSQYTFTNFLSMADLAEFYEIERDLSYAGVSVFGGNDLSERKLIRFGSEELLGYEEPFPIVCLEIKPLNEKFADDCSHRDFLGALMNLGIERETLGDIFVSGHSAYLYCLESIAPYIEKNLTRVKHTVVLTKPCDSSFNIEIKKEEINITVASERVDAIVARVFKLSRDDSVELFREQRVFVNGRLCTGNDSKVKDGDRISVRGLGRFEIEGRGGLTRKQKINIKVLLYI